MILRFVESQNRIQWETFTVQDEFAVQFRVNVGIAIISEAMLGLILSQKQWSGIRYLNDDGQYEIGYGIGDPDDEQGYTEPQAYAEWIGFIRNQQKIFRAQLPIFQIPQAAYDALFSVFIDTGTWRTMQADEGVYDLGDAVRNANWLLAADIISRGNTNRELRLREARVMQLGDYFVGKDRNQQIVQGLQQLRKDYIGGLPTAFDTKQAEFAYYRQLGAFLPGMSDLRQRRVVAQARNLAV